MRQNDNLIKCYSAVMHIPAGNCKQSTHVSTRITIIGNFEPQEDVNSFDAIHNVYCLLGQLEACGLFFVPVSKR